LVKPGQEWGKRQTETTSANVNLGGGRGKMAGGFPGKERNFQGNISPGGCRVQKILEGPPKVEKNGVYPEPKGFEPEACGLEGKKKRTSWGKGIEDVVRRGPGGTNRAVPLWV